MWLSWLESSLPKLVSFYNLEKRKPQNLAVLLWIAKVLLLHGIITVWLEQPLRTKPIAG